MKQILEKWYIKLIITIFGLALITFGIVFQIVETKKIDKNRIVTATVKEITKETSPYNEMQIRILLTYKYEEKDYTGYLRNYEKEIKENSQVKIYVDDKEPNFFKAYEPFSFGYILIFLGTAITITILSIYIYKLILKIKEKRIIKEQTKKEDNKK